MVPAMQAPSVELSTVEVIFTEKADFQRAACLWLLAVP